MKPALAAAARLPAWIWLPFALVVWHADTLWHPFDFHDDGVLVERLDDRTFVERVQWAWTATIEEVQSNGPFRPTYWLYYRLNNALFADDVLLWRVGRLAILAVSAGLFTWLLIDFGTTPWIAACIVAGGVVAPGRSTIWYHFGFGEAQAMPFVMLALIGARLAARGVRPAAWTFVSALSIAAAVLTKNVFIAVLPATIVLRVWAPGESLWEGIRRRWIAAAVLSSTAVVPVVHLFYFVGSVHGRSGYRVGMPGLDASVRMCRCVATAWSVDYLGAGIILAGAAVLASAEARRRFLNPANGPTLLAAALLACVGIGVYLPALQGEMGPAGRYTVPAAWGVDIAAACLLTALASAPANILRRISVAALAVGTMAMSMATLVERTKSAVGDRMIWQATYWLRDNAPADAVIASTTPFVTPAQLFHVRWHLDHLGRRDLKFENSSEVIAFATDAAAQGELLARFPAGRWASLPQAALRPIPGGGLALLKRPEVGRTAARPGEALR